MSVFWKRKSCPNRQLLAKNWGILQTRMDQIKMNFEYFQIQRWMLQRDRAEKVDEKNGIICLVSMFPCWTMVLKLSKKCSFWNSALTAARNLSLLKQFTYMQLKGLITHFQKMVLFIMLWLTFSEILEFEVEEFC